MADLQECMKNQTSLFLRLTKHVFQTQSKHSNMVFSPLSIHSVLSLIAAGSQGGTLDQLLSFLGSRGVEQLNLIWSELLASVLADGAHLGGPKTICANGVWVHNDMPLNPLFEDIVNKVYRSFVKPVDFQHQANEIIGDVNSWAEEKTRGLIKKILSADSINKDTTRLIIANALYFKGTWAKNFEAARTWKYDFHLLNGTSVQVPFMTNSKRQLVCQHNGFKVLGLRYEQGEDNRRLSMYLILPDANDGLPALVETIASEPGFLDHYLPNKYVSVKNFRIPKFKISFGFEASDMLKNLGLVAPFYGGLTGMVDSEEGSLLQVSKILHKSFIEVDEKGTEAAAVTCGAPVLGACRRQITMDFVADHPFLFLIREDVTGVVLFIGAVLDPSLSSNY